VIDWVGQGSNPRLSNKRRSRWALRENDFGRSKHDSQTSAKDLLVYAPALDRAIAEISKRDLQRRISASG